MKIIDRNSTLWKYLTSEIKDLIEDGEKLLTFVDDHSERAGMTDFSFLVFSFAKAYEGFLKKLLLDVGYLKHEEYYGDEIRIGRILNPNYKKYKESVYDILCDHSTERKELAVKMWETWKKGRNTVFHYFPHNFKRLSYEEAMDVINQIVTVMQESVEHCGVMIDTISGETQNA